VLLKTSEMDLFLCRNLRGNLTGVLVIGVKMRLQVLEVFFTSGWLMGNEENQDKMILYE
jgi:hypothetical protein